VVVESGDYNVFSRCVQIFVRPTCSICTGGWRTLCPDVVYRLGFQQLFNTTYTFKIIHQILYYVHIIIDCRTVVGTNVLRNDIRSLCRGVVYRK